jgi:hypothetical protein
LLRSLITRLPFCLQLALPRLNGTDGAVHLQSDRWRFHSRSQQLAQHIVVGKRPRAARWTWTRHLFFAFGRSTRASLNSSGPLVRRRRRWARSSGGADGSIIFSICSAASSAARADRAGLLTGFDGSSAFSPISTKRRMASGREGSGFWFAIHASIGSISAGGMRTSTGTAFTGGRPMRLFLILETVDFFMPN